MKKTFVVLIPVVDSVSDPRESCEMIENTNFDIGGSVQATASDVLGRVMFELGIKKSHNIEVEPITDFMDRFNDQEIEAENYFMSYVYA